jgi:hypothetical protein
VQSSDYLDTENGLQLAVLRYYKAAGRDATCFSRTKDEGEGRTYLHFLIDKKHVIRYGFALESGVWMGRTELGIGPEYFDPGLFWSVEDSTRFVSPLDAQSVHHNLGLLDEFFRRDVPPYVIK